MKMTLLYMIVFITVISNASQYKVPKKPASIAVADVNLDGYPDIVLGHDPDSDTKWSGISILINDGKGNFTIVDSLFLLAGQPSVKIENIDSVPYPEVFAKSYSYENNNEYIAIIKNNNLDSVLLFPLNTVSGINSFEVNDINYDSCKDIIVISHQGKFWGILYNDGNGRFLTPEYYDLDYYPNSLAVGDLNNDSRSDIAISGSNRSVKVYFNTTNGYDTLIVDTSPIILSDIKITDINNDGINEIIGIDEGMPGTKKRVLIYSNDGNNNFQLSDSSQWLGEAMAKMFIADINNDNYVDIIYNVTCYYPNSDYELFHTYVLFNNKDGTFQDPLNYYTGICSHISCAADLNGDGWKDIVTLNYDFYNPPPDTCTIHILFNDGTGIFINDTSTAIFWERTGELGGGGVYSFATKGNEVFAGTASGVYRSTNNGNSWSDKSGALNTSALTIDYGGNIYAGTDAGLFRSTDSGDNWIEVNGISCWIDALVVNMNGDIIAGCLVEGIYISTDRGNSWGSGNSGLTTSWIYSLAVNKSGDIFAGTSKGIFRSTDYGNNWTEVNDGLADSAVYSIVVNEKGIIFCGTENGMYSSTNNGSNWSNTNLRENRVKSIITIGDSVIFAGTYRRGVYYSKDGGNNWIQINGGLLNPSILSLAVNSENNILVGASGSQVYKSVNSITSISEPSFSFPSQFILYQNYPNPTNPTSRITFDLPKASHVTLNVYNTLGQQVATLVNEQYQPGRYEVQFDGSNLTSGVYFYRIVAGEFIETKKMILVQ